MREGDKCMAEALNQGSSIGVGFPGWPALRAFGMGSAPWGVHRCWPSFPGE